MTRPVRTATIAVVGLVAAMVAACSAAPADPRRHPLPRLPELGGVVLPGGFVADEQATAPFASAHPIHVGSIG
jgi:hypothetical protein